MSTLDNNKSNDLGVSIPQNQLQRSVKLADTYVLSFPKLLLFSSIGIIYDFHATFDNVFVCPEMHMSRAEHGIPDF